MRSLSKNKAYRLHLYSENRILGSWADPTFYVDLPISEIPEIQYQVALESFTTSADTGSTNTPFVMVLGTSLGDNTYSTLVSGQQGIVAHCRLPYPTSPVTMSSVGFRISSLAIFKSAMLNVRLQDMDGTLMDLAAPTWAATLVIYPVGTDFTI